MPMPAIEYSSTGRRPTRSLMAPSMGMKMNCSKPKTAAMMPYQNACASLPLTKSPIRMGSTGTTRPMPSMSMKTQTRMKLRLPARAGAAGEDGEWLSWLVLSDMHAFGALAKRRRVTGFWRRAAR